MNVAVLVAQAVQIVFVDELPENTNDVVISHCDPNNTPARASAAVSLARFPRRTTARVSFASPPPPEKGFSDSRVFMVSSSVLKFTADFDTGSTVGLAAIYMAMPPASIMWALSTRTMSTAQSFSALVVGRSLAIVTCDGAT